MSSPPEAAEEPLEGAGAGAEVEGVAGAAGALAGGVLGADVAGGLAGGGLVLGFSFEQAARSVSDAAHPEISNHFFIYQGSMVR